jgi:hypothetical protein
MAEQSVYSAVSRAAKKLLLIITTAAFASGCYFEVSTDSDTASGGHNAEALAGLMALQFAQQIEGVTANIVCPTGLSGQVGGQLTCTGTTSDGYTLTVVVREREEGRSAGTSPKAFQ